MENKRKLKKKSFQRMKLILTCKHISIHTRKRVLYSEVWLPGLGNFKTSTKETRHKRNLIPLESATNLMDCKEIKQNNVSRQQDHSQIQLVNAKRPFLAM